MAVTTGGEIIKELLLVLLTATPNAFSPEKIYSLTTCPKQVGYSAYQAYQDAASADLSTSGKCTCASTTNGLLFYCDGVTREQFERSIGAVQSPAVHAIVAHNSNLAGLSPHFLAQFKNLRRLEMTNSQLTPKSFDCTMLDGMTQLEYIDLSNNPQIRSLCANFLTPKRPTQRPFVVKLQNIGLTRLPKKMFWEQLFSSDGDAKDSIKFRVIDLSDNKLITLEAGLFRGLDSLEALDLSNNGLTALESAAFVGRDPPATGENPPSEPAPPQSPLKYLNLEHNELKSIDRATLAVAGGGSLLELTLANNKLKALSADVFQDVPQLTTLDLSNNQITSLPNELFKDLSALETLVLNGNKIKVMPLKIFSTNNELRQLGLAGFAGSDLPSAVLSDGPNALDVLDLGSGTDKMSERARKSLAAELGLTLDTVRSHTAETIDKM